MKPQRQRAEHKRRLMLAATWRKVQKEVQQKKTCTAQGRKTGRRLGRRDKGDRGQHQKNGAEGRGLTGGRDEEE